MAPKHKAVFAQRAMLQHYRMAGKLMKNYEKLMRAPVMLGWFFCIYVRTHIYIYSGCYLIYPLDNLTVCYGKASMIDDLQIKHGDFP